jgi:hypothetical protein
VILRNVGLYISFPKYPLLRGFPSPANHAVNLPICSWGVQDVHLKLNRVYFFGSASYLFISLQVRKLYLPEASFPVNWEQQYFALEVSVKPKWDQKWGHLAGSSYVSWLSSVYQLPPRGLLSPNDLGDNVLSILGITAGRWGEDLKHCVSISPMSLSWPLHPCNPLSPYL